MTHTTSRRFEMPALLCLLVALIILAILGIIPRFIHAQSAQNSDRTTDAQQQQPTVESALPHVTTTRGMLNAATATGHYQTISLPGASDEPLVHSSFKTQGSAPQTSYHGGTGHAVNVLVMQPAQVYRSGGDGDTLERSALDEETTPPIPSSPAGEYTGSLRIMLTSASPATSIYFTLDGDEPTTDSFLYSHPFTLHASATLKAVAIRDGSAPSSVSTTEYKIIQPTLGFEIGSNGIDSVEIFLTLNAPGAASVAGDWTITDGTLTLCTASLTTEMSLRCAAKLNRGNHDLKATYNGANNGWKLTAGSSVRVN